MRRPMENWGSAMIEASHGSEAAHPQSHGLNFDYAEDLLDLDSTHHDAKNASCRPLTFK